MTISLYRAVPRQGLQLGEKIYRYPGRRLPGNIPYLVDNLWEFTRPDGFPSRRHAIYASRTPGLALENASAMGVTRDDYVACRLEFSSAVPSFHLSVTDARIHPDVGHLQKLVNSLLGARSGDALVNKLELAPLFLPGTTKQELSEAMAGSASLAAIVQQAAAAVRFWDDKPIPNGELFFEIDGDNYYTLQPLLATDSV